MQGKITCFLAHEGPGAQGEKKNLTLKSLKVAFQEKALAKLRGFLKSNLGRVPLVGFLT